MKIVFLDIDGVMNDHRRLPNGFAPILPGPVENLNRILHAVPEAMIVLSSAWRYAFPTDRSVENLLGCHGVDCGGRIHGALESDEASLGGRQNMPDWSEREAWHKLGVERRPAQIRKYLNGQIDGYVVLDDLPLDIPNLVQTVPEIGLQYGHALRAISILNGGPNEAVKR